MPDDSGPLEMPAGLVDWLIEREGDAARSWVTSLPGLIDQMCDRWGLTVAGPTIGGGSFAIVIPVVRGGDRAALKCFWPGTPNHEEVEGSGPGTVAVPSGSSHRILRLTLSCSNGSIRSGR